MCAQPFNEGCWGDGLADDKTPNKTGETAGKDNGDEAKAVEGVAKNPAQHSRRGGIAYHNTTRTYRFL